MNAPVPTLPALRAELIKRLVGVTLPLAALAAYVLGIRVTEELSLRLALGAGMAGLFVLQVAALGMQMHQVLQSALANHPGEAPGARLQRLLEAPARIVLGSLVVWTVGGLVFGGAAGWYLDRGLSLVVFSTVVQLLAALASATILFANFETVLRPVVLAEPRQGGGKVTGSGLRWVRQRWLLPYTFVVALVSVVVFCALTLTSQFSSAAAGVVARVAQADPALAKLVEQDLAGLGGKALLPVVVIGAFLVLSFIITGVVLAARQTSAAASIEGSLRSLVAGAPERPDWVATDELGDLAFASSQVSLEMQHIFTQLKAMAAGDLRAEIVGDSGLLRAFRDSRDGMRRLSDVMVALGRGELAARPDIAGDLGTSFGSLHGSLQAIAVQAQKIAEGDLRQDVEVPGTLGDSIRRMSANLRGMVGQSQDGSAKLSDLVVNLQGAASQLSAATTEQASALTETANTMTEMAQTSAASADRAAELIKKGESAAAVVGEGSEAAHSAVDSTNAMMQALDKVADSSAALAERVRRIDSMTETVGFLADQSSTLAINAAIEAARAGEAGKGFTVVAHEIRTLASDSRKAAAQIRELLAEIREKTRQVDDSVAAGGGTVNECNRLVNRLGEIVGQLGVTVHESVGLMRQVEGAARQHHTGVGQISQALSNMQKVSESIRDGARMLTDLAEKTHDLSGSLQRTAKSYTLPEQPRA